LNGTILYVFTFGTADRMVTVDKVRHFTGGPNLFNFEFAELFIDTGLKNFSICALADKTGIFMTGGNDDNYNPKALVYNLEVETG